MTHHFCPWLPNPCLLWDEYPTERMPIPPEDPAILLYPVRHVCSHPPPMRSARLPLNLLLRQKSFPRPCWIANQLLLLRLMRLTVLHRSVDHPLHCVLEMRPEMKYALFQVGVLYIVWELKVRNNKTRTKYLKVLFGVSSFFSLAVLRSVNWKTLTGKIQWGISKMPGLRKPHLTFFKFIFPDRVMEMWIIRNSV